MKLAKQMLYLYWTDCVQASWRWCWHRVSSRWTWSLHSTTDALLRRRQKHRHSTGI